MRTLNEKDLLKLTAEQAKDIFAQGEEAVTWALLKLSVLAKGDKKTKPSLSTPSSQVPPYEKPAAKKRGKKKRGRKKGHKGARRKPPLTIDLREQHTLSDCPDCGGQVSEPYAERRRVIEDLEKTTVVTIEHTIRTHYCPCCKKSVEPRVTDALPKSTIGNRALALSSWLHYGLGQTMSQVVSVFDSLFHFPVTAGGMAQQWQRLAGILKPWYEQIAAQARAGAVLNVDETGWRVNGKTHWLWCFTNSHLTYYVIDSSRSGEVPSKVLAECFEGTLVTDFYAAYNKVACGDRQLCLAHLLREIEETSKKKTTDEWVAFAKKLKRIVKDALRLARRKERRAPGHKRKVDRIHLRLDQMISHTEWSDHDCRRLVKRLDRHRYSLFTFLDNPAVPADNNRAEREIRPAVIARKNSFQNASEKGARAQAILMTIYRTLKLRGHDALETIVDALSVFISRGALPELPRPPD